VEAGHEDFQQSLKGPIAIAFGYDELGIPPRLLNEFARSMRLKLEIVGGLVFLGAVLEVPEAWVGTKVHTLEGVGAKVAFLTRLGEAMMASPNLVLQDGDMLHLVMTEADAEAVMQAVDKGPEEH